MSFQDNVGLGHDFERTTGGAKFENRPRVIRHVEHGMHPDRVSVCCSEFDCGRIRSLKRRLIYHRSQSKLKFELELDSSQP